MFRIIRYRIFHYLLLSVLMMAILSGFALAQTDSPEVSELTVELWPEFDRSEVLVIYRAQLSDSTPLPAEVTFRFPGYVEAMHAVAVERSGGLYSIEEDLIVLNRDDNALELTFPVENRSIHLEYYDPQILTQQGQARELGFNFSSDYKVETAYFQIQEPLESADFLLSPPASSSFTDKNRQKYQIIEMAGLESGDALEIKATYTRSTDTPSSQLISVPEPTSDIQVVTETAPDGQNFSLAYMLIGVGVLLMLATGGYWWWQNRATSAAKIPARRQPAVKPVQKKRPAPRQKTRGATASGGQSPASYCYQCGSALRADAEFCHVCGTKQRNL